MNRRNFIAAAGVIPLAGCGTLSKLGIGKETAIEAAQGASAVAQADDIYQQILTYLDGDEQALRELQPAANHFLKGLEFIKNDLDKPIAKVFDEALTKYPQYVTDTPTMWIAGVKAISDYATRSGKPVPQNIVAWRSNGEAGWKAAKKAHRLHDYTMKAVAFYNMAKPFALLVL